MIRKFPQLAHPPSRRIEFIEEPSAAGTPLVIVHGMYASAAHMHDWKTAALRESFAPSTFAYPPTASPEEVIERLSECVKSVATRSPGVVLLGHSFGAVVALKAAMEACREHPGAVSRVVAVCAPFGGTSWSRASVPLLPTSRIMQALRPDSSLLAGIHDDAPGNMSSVEFISFSAASDAVVSESSATLRLHGAQHFVLDKESHISVLVSPPAVKRVVSACK